VIYFIKHNNFSTLFICNNTSEEEYNGKSGQYTNFRSVKKFKKGAVILRETYDFMRMPCEFKRSHMPMDEEMPMLNSKNRTDVSTSPLSPFPEQTPIGMAYVPYQQWDEIYEASEGFCKGTMFPMLDYPFKGGDCPYE